MKVNLVYPKIPENSSKFHDKCIAFDKVDGTNLHWIWSLTNGWHLFGTRRSQFNLNNQGIIDFNKEHTELVNTIDIFETFKDKLAALFCNNPYYCNSKVTVFTEFWGVNSFAGNHSQDDEHKLIMIDVGVNGDIIFPELFIKDFSNFEIAKVIYTGKYSGQFAEDVRNGKYNVNEGVVVKGLVDKQLFMTKIKTNAYLKSLKDSK